MIFESICSNDIDFVRLIFTKVQCNFEIEAIRITPGIEYLRGSDSFTIVHIRGYSERVKVRKYHYYCNGSEEDDSRLRCR